MPANWDVVVTNAAYTKRVELSSACVAAHSSLSGYADLGHTAQDGLAVYLDDWSNREGTRTLTKCRLGYMMLMRTVAQLMGWPAVGGVCVLCDAGEVEDVPHFTQRCAALKCCRERLGRVLAAALPFAGPAGASLLAEFQRGGQPQLRLLLGAEQGAVAGLESGSAAAEQHGMARWIVDKAAKNFLSACWKMRSAVLGEVCVEHKRLVHRPSSLVVADLAAQQVGFEPAATPRMENRQFWLEWAPGSRGISRQNRSHRPRARKPFFAVCRTASWVFLRMV